MNRKSFLGLLGLAPFAKGLVPEDEPEPLEHETHDPNIIGYASEDIAAGGWGEVNLTTTSGTGTIVTTGVKFAPGDMIVQFGNNG